MACDLSTLTRAVGYDQIYSESEFRELLKVDLSSKTYKRGWCFWKPESELAAAAVEELDEVSPPDLLISSGNLSGSETTDRIKCLMDQIALSCESWENKYLVQFWAPEMDNQHLYLTTAHQPFAVGPLLKGFCWYRERCMRHRYRVDEGADEDELGAVGRAYRSKHPESTPDLRLYSTNEFPLRNDAARYGLRSFLALPVFDLPMEKCYGVIEVSYLKFGDMVAHHLTDGLRKAKLRTTHCMLDSFNYDTNSDEEITKMLELAMRVMPQLQMAQVWVPCQECSRTSNNLNCMERETYITAADRKVKFSADVDKDMLNYLEACSIHNLQVGKYTNMIAAVMLSNNMSCIFRNVHDFSISKNPLAHYAQKARLSSCFAICLRRSYRTEDVYLVEFFLQFNSREDCFTRSFLPLLVRTMGMTLKYIDYAYEGEQEEDLIVEVCRGIKFSYGESSQSNGLSPESIRYRYQRSEELHMLTVTKGCKRKYLLSDFTKYLQKADLHCLQPSEKRRRGWVFWSEAREELSEDEVDSNSPLLRNPIQEKIILLIREITSNSAAYSLAQFWAPKVDADGCYLETSDQPFGFGSLYEGLAYFRKQCVEHKYFVDEGEQGELGPVGRVFLNGHPENTPDLLLYSITEFPLRNLAAHCCLRKYLALPLFDLNQSKCVGVLELVEFSNSALEVIGKALEATSLRSTFINFKPTSQGSDLASNNDESRKLALIEIEEACKSFEEIPHLSMVEVWVNYSECPIKSNTLCCMERVWATRNIAELDLPLCQIQHVEAGKGILGMALASKNMSCFCGNLCGFSIADQPLGHYAQRARLDVCFAICLHSQHTGDLLHVLEFYLNQGPGGYEYLRSFLCLLLPTMKQKLKSFKLASGQLREKFVVEVVEFPEVNTLGFSETDQPDEHPFTLKFVKYQHQSKDKQVQFAPEEIITSTSASNLKEKYTEKETDGEGEMELNFGQKRKDAGKVLGVCESTLKRRCKEYGSDDHTENTSPTMREKANESAGGPTGCIKLPPLDLPVHQNVPLSDPKGSADVIVQSKVDMVVVYAKYESKTIKFKLCHSAGVEKLVNEVATRLKLDAGSFELEYLDEINEKILLTCDADLELCLENMVAVSKTHIQVFVKSI